MARAPILEWRSAVLNCTLPATQKLALVVLAEFADADGSNCYPSIPSIARLASVNERTVRRALDSAEAAGFIERSQMGTSKGWRRYVYRLGVPVGADTRPPRGLDRPDTESTRSTLRADTESTRSAETYGLSVQNVRTLCPERADTESTDLSITYPLDRGKSGLPKNGKEQSLNAERIPRAEFSEDDLEEMRRQADRMLGGGA